MVKIRLLTRRHAVIAAVALILITISVNQGLGWANATNNASDNQHPLGLAKAINKSKNGLLAYKGELVAKIKKVKETNKDNVFATITLAKFLTEEELKDLVNKYHFKVQKINLRAYEPNGLRATIQMQPTVDGDLVDHDTLGRMLEGNQASLKGVIEIVGFTTSNEIAVLASDPRVFVVDPSADNLFIKNPKNIYMPGLFWYLENNRMVK